MTKVRTQLDKERLFKKQQAEGKELLDEMTQANEEKAAKVIMEKEKEAEKATQEDEFKKIEELEKSRKWTRKEYIWKLGETMNELAKHMDLPNDWYYRINCGEEKLNLIIHSPDGKSFGRGIVPTGATTYDFHAIGVLVMQAENTVDKVLQRGAYRPDGIILPKWENFRTY